MNPKKFLIELKRRNASEGRDYKRCVMQISNIDRSKKSSSLPSTGDVLYRASKKSVESSLQCAFLDLSMLVRRLIRE